MIESLLASGTSLQTMWLFLIAGVLLVCELFVFSYFLLFIGVGVAMTGILSFFGVFSVGVLDSLAAQIFSIVIFSIVALFVLRPLMNRLSTAKDSYVENANLQLKVGMHAKVISQGIIECNGTMWKANTTEAQIGEEVKIIEFKDNTAVVQKL